MNCILIGAGEIGTGVFEYYSRYHVIHRVDPFKDLNEYDKETEYDLMLVTIPCKNKEEFVDTVKRYKAIYCIDEVVVFSTTEIGTCEQISTICVHSPIEGKHPFLKESIEYFDVFMGGYSEKAYNFFSESGKVPYPVESAKITEMLKLLSTTLYGINIEYARFAKQMMESVGGRYESFKHFNFCYNKLYSRLDLGEYQRYILQAPKDEGILGHCVLENALLLRNFLKDIKQETNFIDLVLSLGKNPDCINGEKHLNKTWLACEHYGKGKTLLQIAKENNIDKKELKKAFNANNLKTEDARKYYTQQELELIKELSKTKTFVEIAKRLNVDYESLRNKVYKDKICTSAYDPSARDMETRKKISSTLQGIDIEEWDGFKETANKKIRRSETYKEFRKAILERDNYTCTECGSKDDLHVHHIKLFSKYPELRTNPENGITLCESCHLKKHKYANNKFIDIILNADGGIKKNERKLNENQQNTKSSES